MQLYILDRNKNTVATTNAYYDDEHTQTLGAGSSPFTFTVTKRNRAAKDIDENKIIAFKDPQGRNWSMSVVNVDEDHRVKTITAYDVGIELMNKACDVYKADQAYSFEYYFNKFTEGTPWTLGKNELSGLSRKLEWTGRETGLGRLLSLLTEFDNAECIFNVEFSANHPIKYVVDVYKQQGNPNTGKVFTFGNEIDNFKVTSSRSEFVTAICGVGGTPTKNADGTDIVQATNADGTTVETPKIDFSDLEYDDGEFRTTKGDPFLYAYKANAELNPNPDNLYIEDFYDYDTTNPQELLNRTLTKLKTYSKIQRSYEVDMIKVDPTLRIGDTVKLIDQKFNPPLYLQARVSQLVKSYKDKTKNTVTFSNYQLLTDDDRLRQMNAILNAMPSGSEITNIVANTVNVWGAEVEKRIVALQSADGRSTVYYDAKPSNAKEGDTAFVKNPNSGNMEIWNYVGDQWTLTAGDATFDDVKKQIDKAQADAQTAITTANDAVSTANDNADKFGTDFTTLKKDVTKSVADVGEKADTAIKSANEALEQAGTANSDVTTIKSDMDTVKGTLETVATSEQLDGVKKTAVSAQALAETNAESIKNTVTKTELTTAKSEWSSAQSTITAGQISTEINKVNQTITDATKNLVSQTVLSNAIVSSETGTKQVISESIANISVGGRNYLPETSFETIKKWITSNTLHQMSIDSDNKLNGNNSLRITASAPGGGGDAGLIATNFYGSHSKGDVFKFSFWAKSISGNTSLHTELNGGIGATNVTITTEWERYVVNLTYSNATIFYFWLNGAGVCLINSPKLESGTQVTDWSAAPEDQASVIAVNAIEQTVEGMKQTVANAATKTEVTTLAGQITSTISAVQGGGINLYTDTKNFNNLASWNSSYAWTKTADTYNGLAVAQTTQDFGGLSQYIQVKKGDILTYSTYVKNTSGTGTSMIFWSLLNNQDEGSYSTATVNQDNNVVTITDSWQRVSATIVVTSDGYLRPRLERTGGNTNTLHIAGIKLEKGSLATPWSAAPEDIQSQFTQTQSMIDLRVEKDGVVNAVNISPEAILINGNKLHVTGQTTVDNGVITNAMIANATITGAQIANATIVDANIANINGNKIAANSITVDKLVANFFETGMSKYGDKIKITPEEIQMFSSSPTQATLTLTGNGVGFRDIESLERVGAILGSPLYASDPNYNGLNITLPPNADFFNIANVDDNGTASPQFIYSKGDRMGFNIRAGFNIFSNTTFYGNIIITREQTGGVLFPATTIFNGSKTGGIAFADNGEVLLGEHSNWRTITSLFK